VNAIRLFANIEYEVDELRRDITVCNLAKDRGILPSFFHDKLIVDPGLLSTKQGKPYTVYSPFQRQWLSVINADVDKYLAEAEAPSANSPSVKDHSLFQKLFASEIPSHIEGFQCSDKDQMSVVWPAKTDVAREVNWTYNEDIVSYMRGIKDAAPFSPHKVSVYPSGLGRSSRGRRRGFRKPK